jgi:iron-sulfur cluster assembly accessory protein
MTITVTSTATARINKITADKAGAALRIAVNGGGCSGFQYEFTVEEAPAAADDVAIEQDGAMVLVDAVSLPFLKDAVVDFVDDLMGQSFRIKNPQAKSSCGCGVSFSV